MVNNLITFLITIFFFSAHASEFAKKEITLPHVFKKEYWYNLDLYRQGHSFIYKEHHDELENLKHNNIVIINSYNYNKETEIIKKNNEKIDSYREEYLEMNKKLKYDNKESKEIKARLKQKIASHELDIMLLRKEIEIPSKKSNITEKEINSKIALLQEYECKIDKINHIIEHCTMKIEQNKRNAAIKQEKINNHINIAQDIIKRTQKKMAEPLKTISFRKNIMSLEEFLLHTKKFYVRYDDSSDMIFLQSIIASFVQTGEVSSEELLKIYTFYRYYIFALGAFFRWYTNLNPKDTHTNILLQNIMDYFLQNSSNETIKPYQESCIALILDGLSYYETYVTIKKNARENLEILKNRVESIKDILLLIDPFRNIPIFKNIYEKNLEKLDTLMKKITGDVQETIDEVTKEYQERKTNIKVEKNTVFKTISTIHLLRNITVLIVFSALFFLLQTEKTVTT